MNLKINPLTNGLNGEITAPGSKSYSHRVFIAAGLANGISIIKNPLTTGDVKITMKTLEKLGIKIQKKDENLYIVNPNKNELKSIEKVIDCGNSGTSIRIFSVLSLLVKGGLTLTGEFFKLKRPILPLLEALQNLGGKFRLKDGVRIKRTRFSCNKIKIRGDISSQFITALLMICPLLKCKNRDYIEIELITPLTSKPFVEITIDVLNSFGIVIKENFENNTFYVTNEQSYRSQSYTIPGDFSSAAFLIVAAVLSSYQSNITINNLSFKNFQGDKKIIDILLRMGAHIEYIDKSNQIIINSNRYKYPLTGIEIDCLDIPDLFPILSVVGAFAEGKTVLFNISNLRNKESNRISSITTELRKMGVKLIEEYNKLTIFRCEKIKGIKVNHANDHRIAMACVIAALNATSASSIENSEIVNDSYPTFFKDLEELGVIIEEE
ncbi:hypothetical protein LCGC14_2083280 [marine sediment metagenome]|uniref:3-phosphoshikimate 1-carboxyvinyltransferase n=1 Tax=marine sediment metagenome TaxID=412755 RepID=A0A0F9F269_9ZZZZ